MKTTLFLSLIAIFLSPVAHADGLNAPCQALWGTLRGDYDAVITYANGASEPFELSVTQKGMLDFALLMNGSETVVTLTNGTLSGHETCVLQGAGATLTELAVPGMYDADINGVEGVLVLKKK